MKYAKLKKHLQTQSGFTLVEVMVAGAVVAILMLGFSSYMFQQAKQGQAQQTKQNFSQLKANVVNASSQSDSLSASEAATFGSLP